MDEDAIQKDPRSADVAASVFDFVNDFLDDQAAGVERPLEDYLARYPGAAAEVEAEYLRMTQEDG
ncbi:MAG: hypothetical protein KDB61_13940, partial [Planctomycetes bacterium]|nr:hypothetical protein [Planctomycetota bacterium]